MSHIVVSELRLVPTGLGKYEAESNHTLVDGAYFRTVEICRTELTPEKSAHGERDAIEVVPKDGRRLKVYMNDDTIKVGNADRLDLP